MRHKDLSLADYVLRRRARTGLRDIHLIALGVIFLVPCIGEGSDVKHSADAQVMLSDIIALAKVLNRKSLDVDGQHCGWVYDLHISKLIVGEQATNREVGVYSAWESDAGFDVGTNVLFFAMNNVVIDELDLEKLPPPRCGMKVDQRRGEIDYLAGMDGQSIFGLEQHDIKWLAGWWVRQGSRSVLEDLERVRSVVVGGTRDFYLDDVIRQARRLAKDRVPIDVPARNPRTEAGRGRVEGDVPKP